MAAVTQLGGSTFQLIDVVIKEGDPVAMFNKTGSNATADAVGRASNNHATGHTPAW
jgi:hypothetical protein